MTQIIKAISLPHCDDEGSGRVLLFFPFMENKPFLFPFLHRKNQSANKPLPQLSYVHVLRETWVALSNVVCLSTKFTHERQETLGAREILSLSNLGTRMHPICFPGHLMFVRARNTCGKSMFVAARSIFRPREQTRASMYMATGSYVRTRKGLTEKTLTD